MMRRLGIVAASAAVATIVRGARAWSAVRVAGPSMEPALREGELLAVRPLRRGEPLVGQIVVARAHDREVIKRVGELRASMPPGSVWLVGDNPARSTDSRTTGPVAREAIVGVAVACYWPPTRARMLQRAAGGSTGEK